MEKSNNYIHVAEQESSPKELVEALHEAFGEHKARAVHARGIILKGTFKPSEEASELTKASHLQGSTSKVTVRFSDFTGIPDIPDNSKLANPRGFAIKFQAEDGSSTDIVSHSFDGFPVSNTDQFRELLMAIAASNDNSKEPSELDNYLEKHPAAKNFLSNQKNPKSYATIKYFGVNSFKFTNKKGESHFIRYQFIPEDGEELLSKDEMKKSGSTYLMDEIKERISNQLIRFNFLAQIAEDGDKIEDPSIAWPSSRKLVSLGIIEIEKLSDNTSEEDKALSFIPNNLPDGIETADPMLDFRSRAYPISVKERNR